MPVVVEDGTCPYVVWMEDWEIGIERGGGVGGTRSEDEGGNGTKPRRPAW